MNDCESEIELYLKNEHLQQKLDELGLISSKTVEDQKISHKNNINDLNLEKFYEDKQRIMEKILKKKTENQTNNKLENKIKTSLYRSNPVQCFRNTKIIQKPKNEMNRSRLKSNCSCRSKEKSDTNGKKSMNNLNSTKSVKNLLHNNRQNQSSTNIRIVTQTNKSENFRKTLDSINIDKGLSQNSSSLNKSNIIRSKSLSRFDVKTNCNSSLDYSKLADKKNFSPKEYDIKEIAQKREKILGLKEIKDDDFYNRTLNWKLENLKKRVELKDQKENLELNKYSFSPKISESAEKIKFNSDEFYVKNLIWKQNIERFKQEELIELEKKQYDECFFEPNIYRNSLSLQKQKKSNDHQYQKNVKWKKQNDELKKEIQKEIEMTKQIEKDQYKAKIRSHSSKPKEKSNVKDVFDFYLDFNKRKQNEFHKDFNKFKELVGDLKNTINDNLEVQQYLFQNDNQNFKKTKIQQIPASDNTNIDKIMKKVNDLIILDERKIK